MLFQCTVKWGNDVHQATEYPWVIRVLALIMTTQGQLKCTTELHSLLFLRECVCFSLLLHCVLQYQFGTLSRAALLYSVFQRGLASGCLDGCGKICASYIYH